MRNFFSVLLLCSVLSVGGLQAQNLKLGHIDFQQLIQSMPEREVAAKAYAKVVADMEAQLTSMRKDYADKLKDFQAQEKTLSDVIRTTKEDELKRISQQIQTFQEQAQGNLSKEETKLMQPILEKAHKAIAEVGKEQNCTYILEVAQLYYHSDKSIDLLSLVKAKLGIK